MAKFHINSKGVPAPCKATKGNCPFGSADSHYDTMEKAQEAANKINEEQFGIISKINHESKMYDIPENTAKETRIDKKLLLENNHSLRRSGDIWVHLDEDENVVGTMNDPVVLVKENGELLEIVDNDSDEIKESITRLKTLNLMSKFGLINQDKHNTINLYTPNENIEEYKNINKEKEQKQNENSYNAFFLKMQARGGNQTAELFGDNDNEISAYFRQRENLINSPKIVNYDPKFDEWEDVPSADNFSIEAWQNNNLDIQKINDKWAVTDEKGNIYGRLNNPAIAVNFETETIESIGEVERIQKECENASQDDRFIEDNNKLLNKIGLVKIDDKSQHLGHIKNLFNYSWAFKKE